MNPFYRIALRQGTKLLKNPKKTQEMLSKAIKKTSDIKGDQNFVKSMKQNIVLSFAMTRDFVTGKYRKLNYKTVAKIFAGLIYFVFIIDLVPDFLGIIGFADDAAVLAWVVSSLTNDIEKYNAWKEENSRKTNKLEKNSNENNEKLEIK